MSKKFFIEEKKDFQRSKWFLENDQSERMKNRVNNLNLQKKF